MKVSTDKVKSWMFDLSFSVGDLGATYSCANCDGSTIMDTLWQLHPEMIRYIKLNCLFPYLNRHKILTRDERFFFTDSSKSPYDKITKLLQILDSKDDGTVLKFLQALKEETEHTGHKNLCALITQKGIKLL